MKVTGLTDLERLEKQAFRRFYEDGLFDVFLGLMLAAMAVGALITDWVASETVGVAIMAGVAFLLVTVLLGVRRRLLRSRLGEFKPVPRRRRRITLTRLALLASALAGVIAFVVAAVAYRDTVPLASLEVFMPLGWFLNAVVVFGAMAYFLDVPRFYVYGLLFGAAMPLLVWPDVFFDVRLPAWVAFGSPAVVITTVGLVKLGRFLRNYPIPESLRGDG